MRTISSVNLLKNRIGSDQAMALVSMLKEHPTLKSLCGNRGDETELDMSDKMHCAGDAVMLAVEVVDNGALSVLNLTRNEIGGYYDDDDEFFATPEGMDFIVLRISLFLSLLMSQVLLLSLMPSRIWGPYRQ
jgi:hypothetical protein